MLRKTLTGLAGVFVCSQFTYRISQEASRSKYLTPAKSEPKETQSFFKPKVATFDDYERTHTDIHDWEARRAELSIKNK